MDIEVSYLLHPGERLYSETGICSIGTSAIFSAWFDFPDLTDKEKLLLKLTDGLVEFSDQRSVSNALDEFFTTEIDANLFWTREQENDHQMAKCECRMIMKVGYLYMHGYTWNIDMDYSMYYRTIDRYHSASRVKVVAFINKYSNTCLSRMVTKSLREQSSSEFSKVMNSLIRGKLCKSACQHQPVRPRYPCEHEGVSPLYAYRQASTHVTRHMDLRVSSRADIPF